MFSNWSCRQDFPLVVDGVEGQVEVRHSTGLIFKLDRPANSAVLEATDAGDGGWDVPV